jgi:MFS transporter, OFA family, oxalate/formate antiporter
MYYGWAIVALAFVSLMASYGLLFGYSVFVPHLASSLDLSRATVSAPFSVCVAVYSLMSLVTGGLTDRIGPRRVMLVGGAALALGFVLIGQAESPALLFVGMGAVMGIGMSAAYIPCTATVVRWFVARRGLALALASMGLSASMAAGPFAAVSLIEAFGWREAALTLGLIGGGAVFLCALGMRRDPGAGFADRVRRGQTVPEEASLTFAEARRTPTYWVLAGVFVLTWAIMFFPYSHLASLPADFGYAAHHGAGLIGSLGAGGIIGRPAAGWFADRTSPRAALAAVILVQAVACAVFVGAEALWLLYAASTLFGVGATAGVTLFPAMVGSTFGRAHVGAISGSIFAAGGLAGATGPLAAGYIHDATGAYTLAFAIGVAGNLLAVLLVTRLRPLAG